MHPVRWSLGLALVLAACGGGPEPVEEPVRDEVVRMGRGASAALMGALQPRLQDAMARGGPVEAIAFCADTAQALTADVSAALGGGLEVGRTSFRYRNPANAPDAADSVALRYFQEALTETESLPDEHVLRVSDGEYRYYRALVVAPLCLTCHGTSETIPAGVKAALAEAYPEDRAVGYREGDFRGAVRITIPSRSVEPAQSPSP